MTVIPPAVFVGLILFLMVADGTYFAGYLCIFATGLLLLWSLRSVVIGEVTRQVAAMAARGGAVRAA